MLETGSVFDVLASDDADRRLAQRKALALAEVRLDNTLGRFLRAAVTTEEFQARMGAVQEDFARHVAEASAEVGYDQPERILPILASNIERTRRWQPKHTFAPPGPQYQGPAYPNPDAALPAGPGGEDDHLGPPSFPNGSPNVPGNCPNCGSHNTDEIAQTCMDCGFNGNPGHRYEGDMGGGYGDEHMDAGYAGDDYPDYGPRQAQIAQDIKKVNPAEMQDSNDGKGINEPHQDDEDEDDPKIKSSGVRTADGNTDLGGPEPKMDKRLWEPSNLGDPDVDDGRWPTERKDMVDPIGPPNNEHALSEIGGKFTEHVSLPSNSGDAGYDAGGPGPAPHTDTFGKGDQTAPVTHETQPE